MLEKLKHSVGEHKTTAEGGFSELSLVALWLQTTLKANEPRREQADALRVKSCTETSSNNDVTYASFSCKEQLHFSTTISKVPI